MLILNDFTRAWSGLFVFWAADILCFIVMVAYFIVRTIKPAPIASEVKIGGRNISLDRIKSIGLARRSDRTMLCYSSLEEVCSLYKQLHK